MAKQPAKSNLQKKRALQVRARRAAIKKSSSVPSESEQIKQLAKLKGKKFAALMEGVAPRPKPQKKPAQVQRAVAPAALIADGDDDASADDGTPDVADDGDGFVPDDGGVFQSGEEAVANAQDFFTANAGSSGGKIYARPTGGRQQPQSPTIDAPDESGGDTGSFGGVDDGSGDSSKWEQLLQIASEIRDTLNRVETLLSPDSGGG